MVGHYFNQAHKDVMAGVDYLIDRGLVDDDRMGKMGWSAGGHMTNKIITYTDRFKAASSGAGASNWISMYAQSDIGSTGLPGSGETRGKRTHPSTSTGKTPRSSTFQASQRRPFSWWGRRTRVPMPQSVEMYRALKAQGVPTHLYVAPRQPHGWRELYHRLFKANVELDWFERWIMDRGYKWEEAPEAGG